MKQNNLNWFIVVICIVAWSLYEVSPPKSRDLLTEFTNRAQNKDAAFQQIVSEAADMQKAGTNSSFNVLQEAIGTNDLQKYFPGLGATNQLSPNIYILNRLQREAAGKIRLGLDLQGGSEFLVEMDTNILFATDTNSLQRPADVEQQALSQAVEVLRRRIDRFGVAEPEIRSAGGNRILIQLPGLSQADKNNAITNIQKAAYLEFRMAADNSAEIVQNGDVVPPGYELMKLLRQKNGETPVAYPYIIKKKAEDGLAGNFIDSAQVSYDASGQLAVSFTLNDDGRKKFADLTTRYASPNRIHSLCIVLDGQLYSVATIGDPILTGDVQISGGNETYKEVQDLVTVLRNPLKAPLKVVSSKDVGPTLGQVNINSGINASMYAVIFVSVFMLLYYRLAGVAAIIALITNVIILLGVMCAIPFTFTLPGIAGGVLTVGMAVDANVLIYERIREELAKGKSLRGAIDAGYARAFGTIFDSHVTTLISSIILIWTGTGEIKGFGVTLTIGVAASLFTALVVTRLIFNFLTERNFIQSLSMMHIIKSSKVGFMSVAKPLFVITWVFAIVAICYGGFARGEKLFGVDFLGGDNTTFSYAQDVNADKLREALDGIGIKDAQIQYQKDVASKTQLLSVTTAVGTAEQVKTVLAEKFPEAQFKATGGFTVGASVGKEIQKSAVIAALCAMLGILVYVAFRYEFSFAVAAVIAVLHDVLLTIGAFCIANEISGRQFSATVVAAILTIIGFSINDKIVIFDRIREDLKLGMRGSFKEIINHALNQTLSRTIITSGTVFIATLVLFIWGGGAINDFAFTFLVGIITGTYSSIFVASVIVLWWHKGERPNIGASQVAVQNSASAKV